MASVFSVQGKDIVTGMVKKTYTNEPKNVSYGVATQRTALATDVALDTESADARVAGTSTQQTTNANVPNDTYQVIGTITAGGSRAVTNAGLFDSTSFGGSTTSSSTQTTTQTTIPVTANASFPGSGNYYILVESEVETVTAGQGTNTWTVTRAALGTSAAQHANGIQINGAGSTAGDAKGGFMLVKGDFAVINLSTNDSIQFTVKLQFT